MATTEPIRDQSQLHALADYFLQKGEFRNYTLVVLGTCTALRISDLLGICWSEIYDVERDRFKVHVKITEQKTGKIKLIALNEQAIDALRLYYPHSHSDFVFVNNRKNAQPISRVQAWRIIQDAAAELGLDGNLGCHSLRKTWGYHAWTSGNVSPIIITEIYNHSSYAVTKRYLGVAQDDLDKAYLEMRLF